MSNIKSKLYKDGPPEFTMEIYENLGKQLLISILDIFDKNPVSRIHFTDHKSIKGIRQYIASHITKYERFGKIANIKDQVKNINQQIDNVIYKKLKNRIFAQNFNFDKKRKLENKSQRIIRNKPRTKKLTKKEKIEKSYQNLLDKFSIQKSKFRKKIIP